MIVSLLHGFMGAPSDWDLLRGELRDYDLVTPLIQPAENWDAGMTALEDALPEGSVLIGYSMGARLALGLALTKPQRYRGLIFCSGNPGIEDEQQRQKRYASDCRIADRIDNEQRAEFLNYWYTSAVFRSLSPDVREQEIQRKLARSGDDWSSILRCYSVAKQPNYWPQLTKLPIPCMAIAGQQDKKYVRLVTRMGALPNIQARIVPDCGHIVHHEQPRVFLNLVRTFLALVQPDASDLID